MLKHWIGPKPVANNYDVLNKNAYFDGLTVTSLTCVRKSKTDTSLCGNLMTTEHNWTGAPRSRTLLSSELFGIDAGDVEATREAGRLRAQSCHYYVALLPYFVLACCLCHTQHSP